MFAIRAQRPYRASAAVFLLCFSAVGARGEPLFPNPVFRVGYTPTSVLSADLNGDGRPDLITVNSGSSDVSVLLARQGGDFNPEVRIPIATGSVMGSLGDFNGDAKPDLATVSMDFPSSISILLGRGDGSFLPPAFLSSQGDSPDLAIADFNNDHRADLAVIHRIAGAVSVFLGGGDGTFAPMGGFAGLPALSMAVVAGDFNRDGRMDLAVGSAQEDAPQVLPGSIVVLTGLGNGTFQPRFIPTHSGVFDLAIGDFNRDNKLDLAASEAAGRVSLFLGGGDGSFSAPSEFSSGEPGSLIVGDFNSDSFVDLAVGNRFSDTVSILLGRGNGTFLPRLISFTVFGPTSLVAGEFTADGQIDLATAGSGSTVGILEGQGDGRFGPVLRGGAGRAPEALAAADFNRDGKQDVATGNFASDDVAVLLGTGDGSLGPQTQYAAGTRPQAIVSADFNQDAVPDLATANGGTADVSVRLGLGDGSFGSESRFLTGDGPTALAAGDFNLDGKTDLAAAMPDSGEVVILDGAGNGSFAPGRTVPFTGAQFLAVGEVNRDGLPDLVSATSFDPHVAVLFGRGDGTFNPPPPPAIGSGTTVTAMAVGDLDGDGNVDAVLAVNYPPEALVFRGLGDGTFSEATHNPILSASFAIAMGDFDLDHKTDLAVAESSAGDLLILKGLGGGSFGFLGRTVAGKGPVALVASDFNRDGWLDLVSANVGSNDVQVALNQGIPGVTPNRLPAARAGADGTHECTSGEGAEILLDGSESTDPDSTPGTHDDIVLFEWYGEVDNPTPVLLGSGERLAVTLPLGAHTITLKVIDAAGASATDSLVLTVADTHGPLLSIDPTPAILWPPDSRLIEVHVSTDASDECGPVSVILESVSSIESGRPGSGGGHGTTGIQGAAFGTADFDFSLRATRAGNGGGLRYLVTYRATDESGNVSRATTFVIVPHDLRRSLPPGTPPVISPGTTLRPPAGASHPSP